MRTADGYRIYNPWRINFPNHWHLKPGWGCRIPIFGIMFEALGNGRIWRVSLWPNRFGFHIVWWQE